MIVTTLDPAAAVNNTVAQARCRTAVPGTACHLLTFKASKTAYGAGNQTGINRVRSGD